MQAVGDKIQHGLSAAKPSAPCAPLLAAVLYAKGASLDSTFLTDEQRTTQSTAEAEPEPTPAPLTDRGNALPLGNGRK